MTEDELYLDQQELIRQQQLDVRRAYVDIFSNPQGQKVWGDLMHHFGFLNKTTMGTSPELTYFNEGSRNVILHIYAMTHTTAPINEQRQGEYDDGGSRSTATAEPTTGAAEPEPTTG